MEQVEVLLVVDLDQEVFLLRLTSIRDQDVPCVSHTGIE
jgi:hypothetical protein